MTKVRVAVLALLAALEAIGLLGGCGSRQPRYVGEVPGQTHVSTQRDPSMPVAMHHDVPPPGPGARISRPGQGPVDTAPTVGDRPSPDTLAPRTIAPGDVDSTVESRQPTPAPVVVGGTPPEDNDRAASGTAPAPTPPPTTGGPGAGTGNPDVGPGSGTGNRDVGPGTGTTGTGTTSPPAPETR